MPFKKIPLLLTCFSITALSILIISCRSKSLEGMIIVSETRSEPGVRNFITGEGWRYIPESRIIAVDPDRPTRQPVILTGTFYSAMNPDISPDGKKMAFAGQSGKNDPWQIWLIDLTNSAIKQVTRFSVNCTDPVFLPGNRLVFSMPDGNDSVRAGHSLYSCKTDGSDLRRITFNPHTYFASHVLRDGRIVTLDRQVSPGKDKQDCMVLRPDGTKAELFYAPGEGAMMMNRPRETEDGRIVFIESTDADPGKGDIVSIKYNRPLHSRTDLTGRTEGSFYSVFPENTGRFLVSYSKSPTEKPGLYEFDPVTGTIGQSLYNNPGYNVLEAVVARPYERQKLLPSEVDMQVKTGLLLCQDINVIDPAIRAGMTRKPEFRSIEITGRDSSWGIVQVESDGSFYIKAKADSPFRISVVDQNGQKVGKSCDWIWLRPNERRGCVGCHEDHELSPENRLSLAVKNMPVAVPVHIEKLKEKTVELE